MRESEALAIVHQLNDWIDPDGESTTPNPFVYSDDGTAQTVSFLDQPLWNSENEERPYDEKKNDWTKLDIYLCKEALKLLDSMTKTRKRIVDFKRRFQKGT